MATAPEATTSNPVSKAAKRPQKTQKFMDDLKHPLMILMTKFSLSPVNNERSPITILQRTTETHSSPSGPKRLMPV